jgi:hypothetical protein
MNIDQLKQFNEAAAETHLWLQLIAAAANDATEATQKVAEMTVKATK